MIVLLMLLLGQLPSLISRFLFQTCSPISPFFLPSCLEFHTITSVVRIRPWLESLCVLMHDMSKQHYMHCYVVLLLSVMTSKNC